MMNRAVSFGTTLIRVSANLATGSLLCGAGINFANIVGRYFFHSSIAWAEEVMLYLMLASVFFGSAAATLHGGHISMDVVLKVLPEGWRKTVGIMNDLLFITVACVLIYLAIPVILDFIAFDQRSDAARIPIAIPQMIIPVGLALMICATILHRLATRQQLKATKLETTDALLAESD
jgi:TRAP-type C4-dicarboxylate transport system permease small subunit